MNKLNIASSAKPNGANFSQIGRAKGMCSGRPIWLKLAFRVPFSLVHLPLANSQS